MRVTLFFAIAGFALLQAGAAHAQWAYDYGVYPGNYATSGTQATLEGISDVLRGRAKANLDNARAAGVRAESEQKQLEARYNQAKTYYDMRKLHDAYTAAQYAKSRTSKEDKIRYAKQALPPRLPESEVMAVTGKIDWPDPLQDEQYAKHRQELDKLFAERAKTTGGIGTDNYAKIKQTVELMTEQLKTNIQDMEPANYMYARDFLNTLAYEARFPTTS